MKILQIIVNDINVLDSEGIQMDDSTRFKGSLFCVVRDNLESHMIGSFIESFNTNNYFCRLCYITQASKQVSDFRTPSSYNEDAELAMATDELCRGVRTSWLLNSLKHFHVCNPGLPPCLVHDLVQYDLCLALNKLVNKKLLSFEIINNEIKNLKFSRGYTNVQIPNLKRVDKLTGTATHNLLLLYALPFAVYNKIGDIKEE